MSAGKIVLLVFGIILVLGAFLMIAGGGIILAVDSSLRDNQGFYNTGFTAVSGDEPVIISQASDIQVNRNFFVREKHPLTIRIQASDDISGKQIFIGVARQTDLQNYLNGIGNVEITGISFFPFNLDRESHPGSLPAAPPTSQTFWVASAAGNGTQNLEWNVVSGSYSLVVMNSDGSSPVHAQIALGAKVPAAVRAFGLGILIAGIVVLAGGGTMIFFAARK